MILFVSCQGSELIPDNNNLLAQHSGEEMFNAIFFAEGEMVQSIPILLEYQEAKNTLLSETDRELNESFQGIIMANISSKDSLFFTEFRNGLMSKDHLKIEATLNRASRVVFQSIIEITEIGESTIRDMQDHVAAKYSTEDIVKMFNENPEETVAILEDSFSNYSAGGRSKITQEALCVVGVGAVAIAGALVVFVAGVVFLYWIVSGASFFPAPPAPPAPDSDPNARVMANGRNFQLEKLIDALASM